MLHPPPLIACFAMVCCASPLAAAPLQLKIDPAASSVTFAARVNIGVDSFTGTIESWSLKLSIPEDARLPDHAVFTADVTALKTGKDDRDEQMRKWLEEARFPAVRYTLKTIRETDTGLEADGELTIHGQTRPLTMPITVERQDAHLTVKGEVTIDHRNFDLKIIRKFGFLTVKPEIKIAFVATGDLE